MLSAMRKSADSIFIKALLILLALSFAFWGVGSWIQPENTADRAALVGGETISRAMIEQRVQQAVGNAYDAASSDTAAYRAAFTEQAINLKLMDLRARDLGIKPGAGAIVTSLEQEPVFADETGRFSEERFLRFLRERQQTKRQFFHTQRNMVARTSLQKMMEFVPDIPKDIMSAVATRRFEERRADIIVVKATPGDTDVMPSDTELMQAYKDNEQRFISPEYRTFTFLAIHPRDVQASITYEEADLSDYYNSRKEDYRISERRVVKQYVFDTQETAQKGLAALKAGEEAAEAVMRDETLRREDLIDAFRDAIFSAEKESYTEPMESPFGVHVYYVADILPERAGTFADTRDRVKEDYIADAMQLRYPAFISDVEDKLAEGADIAATAASFGLSSFNVTLDAEGNILKAGAHEDAGLPYFTEMLRRVFSTETQGVPSPLFAADDTGIYAVFTLKDILPERVKALDEVRGVVADIRRTQIRADDISNYVRDALPVDDASVDMDAVMNGLSEHFSTPSELTDIRRPIRQAPPQENEGIHSTIAEKIFAAEIGDIVFDYNRETSSVVIAHVKADIAAEEAAGAGRIVDMRRTYSMAFFEDFLAQYFAFLRRQYEVRYVNQGA